MYTLYSAAGHLSAVNAAPPADVCSSLHQERKSSNLHSCTRRGNILGFFPEFVLIRVFVLVVQPARLYCSCCHALNSKQRGMSWRDAETGKGKEEEVLPRCDCGLHVCLSGMSAELSVDCCDSLLTVC